jgi:hypothetical protein
MGVQHPQAALGPPGAHEPSSTWEKVRLKKLEDQIQPFKNEEGFEQIANALGIPRPQKIR